MFMCMSTGALHFSVYTCFCEMSLACQETFFPKQCGHTEGVLTVGVKARCSIDVVSVASGKFPEQFRAKCLLCHVHVHVDSAGLHKMLAAGYASGIFPLTFRTRCFLWHVYVHLEWFGLRRLTQNACPGIRVRHFPSKFPYYKCLLWHVHVPFAWGPTFFRL